jgi:hypothetical protein
MGDTIQGIKNVLEEIPSVALAISRALAALMAAFGVTQPRAAEMFAAHIDPEQPTDPAVADVLDAAAAKKGP